MSTEAPALYQSWTGKPHSRFSYSLANSMAGCGHYVELSRIQGYEDPLVPSYKRFGDAVEGAIRGWIQSGGERGIEDDFSSIWTSWKDANLVYKDSEKSWSNMDTMGRRLCTRFKASYEAGELPPMDARDRFNEELFLPDWHKGTGIVYKADFLRPKELLLDFKTAERNRPKDFGDYVALDRQLRVGALVTGIRNVGFLVGAWGNAGGWTYYPGTVTEELVQDVDLWLKAQYGKFERKEFHRAAGISFPNQVCTNCDMFDACLKGDFSKLHRRESAAAVEELEALDE